MELMRVDAELATRVGEPRNIDHYLRLMQRSSSFNRIVISWNSNSRDCRHQLATVTRR